MSLFTKINFKVHKDQTLEFTSIITKLLALMVCSVPQTFSEKYLIKTTPWFKESNKATNKAMRKSEISTWWKQTVPLISLKIFCII